MSAYQIAQHPDDFTRELDEARKIQVGMLLQSVPEVAGFQIAAHSAPAVAVGGDFYDFIPQSTEKGFLRLFFAQAFSRSLKEQRA